MTCACHRASVETAEQWTIYELLPEGRYERYATAHYWASNEDAHRQRADLEKRFPNKVFAVSRSAEKATVSQCGGLHEWSASRLGKHECLNGCGATMDARTGEVTEVNET